MTSFQQPPPPPGYAAPQQAQAPQQPQQQYAQPPVPQQVPQQQYAQPQQLPQQPQQQYAQPQAPSGMPQLPQADETQYQQQATQTAAEAAARMDNSKFPTYLKWYGPNKQKWDVNVPPGYEDTAMVRILPPWAEGKTVFVESQTYFYKSMAKPKGNVIGKHPLFQEALKLAAQSDDARLQKVTSDFGKLRRQYLYNVLNLTDPQSHFGQDGTMKPMILGAGNLLWKAINTLAGARGGINSICSPQNGLVIALKKKKTGSDMMNVEYSCIDFGQPCAIDQYFWPALQNLWDLESVIKPPSDDEVMQAISELGLPMPSMGGATAQVPAAYAVGPQPPAANPYAAPQQPQQFQQPQAPMAPPQQMPQQPMAPQAPMAPPAMAAPPVQSAPPPPGQVAPYQPVPGAAPVAPPPPGTPPF